MQPNDFNSLQNGMSGMSLSGSSSSLGGSQNGHGSTSGRVNYYTSPEEGPPHKLSVTHPDVSLPFKHSCSELREIRLGKLMDSSVAQQKMLASMREAAHANGGDVSRKVAWSKQVLKFIERTQVSNYVGLIPVDDSSDELFPQAAAGESSRISDPTLVRWTDEALNHILTSASSSAPAPLALYLRGDLSASGSFPSYRSKDAKSSFRDFEAAANAGYVKSWFRIGRAYEDFGDIRRAVGAYEKGVEKGDCGSTYRLAMAYLLGQIGIVADVPKAMALLKRAADTADLDTPQRE